MSAETVVWTERYLPMSHGRTRYWEAGSGPATILLHGAGWSAGCETWALAMGPLSSRLRVLALDALNWGPGDVLDVEFSFAYLVDHIREFMDLLGIERANVVGHSMGGWLLSLLAYESPHRVARAVNVAGGGTATRTPRTMVGFSVPEPDDIRRHYAPLAAASGGSLDVETLAAPFIRKRDLPGHPRAFAGVMRHMSQPLTRQRYNTLRRLPLIAAPTLVIWGRDDTVNTLAEVGRPTANGLPHARLVVYDATGHAVPWEQPDRFVRDVLDFLMAGD